MKMKKLDGAEQILGGPAQRFNQMPRQRFGLDLSYHRGPMSFWGEFIAVKYNDHDPKLDIDKKFYYGTFGYRITERWFAYAGYWDTFQHFVDVSPGDGGFTLEVDNGDVDMDIWTVGFSYNILEVLVLKAQYGYIDIDIVIPNGVYEEYRNFSHWSAAISIMF